MAAALALVPDPFGPPSTLHLWGKEFNSTGEGCHEEFCFGGPPPASPVTREAMLAAESESGSTPYVVHELPGVLGWFLGLTDAGPKPPRPTDVDLQVGSDSFIRYMWAHCCMPDW